MVFRLRTEFVYSLNSLAVLRSGSRLLSGASMEMLCEHTLLTSGEVADSGVVFVGWPAKQPKIGSCDDRDFANDERRATSLKCPMCHFLHLMFLLVTHLWMVEGNTCLG